MSYPQSKLDYKELVYNLNESCNNCGSANDVNVPPDKIKMVGFNILS